MLIFKITESSSMKQLEKEEEEEEDTLCIWTA
jgi:hypothetical protein